MLKTTNLTIRIPLALKASLKKIAVAEDRPVSRLVLQALRMLVAENILRGCSKSKRKRGC